MKVGVSQGGGISLFIRTEVVACRDGPADHQLCPVLAVVSKEQRLQAVQAAVILMPDENREVLQTLLYFLSDIASAEENQMTAGNLAVCLAPSIFHLNVSKKESTSPR